MSGAANRCAPEAWSPADWMAAGGTLWGWIERGGTLPGEIVGRSLGALQRKYRRRDFDFTEEARAEGWERASKHWCMENAEYFNPLHDSSPREGFGLWLRGPAPPYGPFGAGFPS